MGMDIYGNNPSSEAGEYFRANIFGWSPILGVALSANEVYGLGFDMSNWAYNDGGGLETQEECDRLADAMTNILQVEEPIIQAEHSDTAKALINAFGIANATERAQASKEHAQEFVAFLRACGGFKIY